MPRILATKKAKSRKAIVEQELENFYSDKTEPTMTENTSEAAMPKSLFSIRKQLKTLSVVLIIAVLGGLGFTTFYFYRQYKVATSDQQVVAQDEVQKIVQTIGAFMDLPEGEEPKLATVTDKEKLKGQVFFARSENGDKVLMYLESKKAILYRPTTQRIIDVTTLSGESVSAPAEKTAEVQPENTQPAESEKNVTESEKKVEIVKVAIYNGTSIKGLAGKIAEKVAGVSGIEVVEKSNAEGEYAKTVVIDISGQNAAMAESLAQTTGGMVGQLADGERKPEADILIIGGKE